MKAPLEIQGGRRSLRKAPGFLAVAIGAGACLPFAEVASGALSFEAYETRPVAAVEEWGDRVPNRSRVVPMFARLFFDLSASEPSLTAVITNAVLEGGGPFALQVRSASGSQQADGSYRFTGDYLRELYPAGTQYLFDWRFSTGTTGAVVWNGMIGWAGGHAWYVTISNLTLVPVPWLNLAPAGAGSVAISWSTNFADHVLEFARELSATGWSPVTNAPSKTGDRLSAMLSTGISNRFFRLREP